MILYKCTKEDEKDVVHMNNVVSINDVKKNNFKKFISNNKDKIYANTPKINTISKEDDWVNETEWDDLFRELSAKEN